MADFARRDFLKRSMAAGSAAALAPSAFAQDKPSDMCIARWKGGDDFKQMAVRLTEEAMKNIGGMGRFVKKGDVVWVKPNMAWDRTPEQAANTNPDLVATVIRLCLEAGASKVKVGDRTCNESKKSYVRSGIEAAAKAAGAEVIYIDDNRFKEMTLGGKRLDKWPVYPEMAEANLLINCPIVKHHCLSKMTACMKGYMGVVGGERGQWHQDIPTCLSDITGFMKPRLCIVDAIRILTANGPTGGNLADVKVVKTVAAGTDIVALDAFAAEILGHKPADIETVLAGEKAGLGKIDYRSLALKEVEIA